MLQIIGLIVAGSLLIALAGIGQIKFIEPEMLPALKYNLLVAPLIILANSFIFIAFTKATDLSFNLAAAGGLQVGIYTLSLAFFSVLFLNGTIGLRTLIGVGLIILGAAIAR